MADTSGFYRKDENGELQYAPNAVYAPTYTIRRENKDTYTYPTEGNWRWFNDDKTACNFLGVDYEKYISGSLVELPPPPQPEPTSAPRPKRI